MAQWEIETKPYVVRISNSLHLLSVLEKVTAQLPKAPFDHEISLEANLAFHAMLLARSSYVVVDQLFDNTGLLWSEGRMIGVSHLIRSAIEHRAVAHFCLTCIEEYSKSKNISKLQEQISKLTMGAKTPIRLPWGDISSVEAYSVMKFIKLLGQQDQQVSQDYDLLSEGTHTNLMQNSYFVMASKKYDNFSNETFKQHAHELLDKHVSAIERTANGMRIEIPSLFNCSLSMFIGSTS